MDEKAQASQIQEIIKDVSFYKSEINKVSPSFCLAKWYQVTVHLQNGHTHSCHHPATHRVDPRELVENSSALHNTSMKKVQRHKMLNGIRPSECDYCWRIEDANPDNVSDRIFKSSENWAWPNLEEAKSLPWHHDFNPRYVEVSFGHACNFKCLYCAPHISSSIMAEFEKEGHFVESPEFSIKELYINGKYPIPKDSFNPYVEAFWRWWPDLIKNLEHFRITGGEPLINPNTFKFLDFIVNNPMPNLHFAINSNLGIPDVHFNKFISLMQKILETNSIKGFDFYTSVDTHGEHAEYIRTGLNYEDYIKNVRRYLDELPTNTKLIFMCTYNALSVPNFRKFLQEVIDLKSAYKTPAGDPRVLLDMPYLKDPNYLSLAVLTKDFAKQIEEDLEFMKDHTHQRLQNHQWCFSDHEIAKMERVLNWFKSLQDNENTRLLRKKFYTFTKECDRRRGTSFLKTFPSMEPFYKICEDIYNNDNLDY
jgi:organic radical activating enzyme